MAFMSFSLERAGVAPLYHVGSWHTQVPSSKRTASSFIGQKCLPTCEQNPHGTSTMGKSEWLAGGGSNEVLEWGAEAARCLTGGGGSQNHKDKLFFPLLISFQPRIPWHIKSKVRVWGLGSQKTSHYISLPEQWVKDNIQDTYGQSTRQKPVSQAGGLGYVARSGSGPLPPQCPERKLSFHIREDLRNDMNIPQGTVRSRQGRETGR